MATVMAEEEDGIFCGQCDSEGVSVARKIRVGNKIICTGCRRPLIIFGENKKMKC